jgi:hypothetical protein
MRENHIYTMVKCILIDILLTLVQNRGMGRRYDQTRLRIKMLITALKLARNVLVSVCLSVLKPVSAAIMTAKVLLLNWDN